MTAQKHITIIYASTSGNVEFACETISRALEQAGWSTELHRAEQTDIQTIKDNNLFIFSSSTMEHGEVNPFFNKLLKEMKGEDLTGKKAFMVGLGDMRYEPVMFNKGIEIVKERFVGQGGEAIGQNLKLNGDPYHQVDNMLLPWVEKTLKVLENEG